MAERKLQMQRRQGKHAVLPGKHAFFPLTFKGSSKNKLAFKKISLRKQIQADTNNMMQEQRIVVETFDLEGQVYR